MIKGKLRKGGVLLGVLIALLIAVPALSVYYDGYFQTLLLKGFADVPEMSSAPGTPDTNTWRIYTYNDGVYVKDDAGTATNLLSSTTMDAAYTGGQSITLDASGDLTIQTNPDANPNQLVFDTVTGSGALGDMIVVQTTSGSITDALDLSDGGITNAVNIGSNTILGAAGVIDFSEFDVSGSTGSVTINDGGDAGQLSVEGSVLDINSLTFVGAGEIASAASSAITLNADSGNAAGEDLIITANNVQLTAAGAMTLSPDGAVTTALDVTDTDYTNGLSLGDNKIIGTTAAIDFTNFDVASDGDVTCVDLTASGTVNVGTWAQDAIAPASAAPHTLTVDGAGAGGVTISGTSTGNITLGSNVVVSDAKDVVIGEGSLTIDDDQNESALVVDSDHSTTGSAILVTSDATSAKAVSITADSMEGGDVLYLDATEGAGFTGTYIRAYDGAANDFSVKRHGEIEIAGNSSADMLTITTGDVQIDDGKVEIDTDEDDTTKIERAQATVTGPVLSVVEQTDTVASAKSVVFIDQDSTAATSSGLEIDSEGAIGIKFDPLVVAGDAIKLDVADSYTGQGIVADLGPWLGTAGEGFIDITTDSAATAEAGHAIHINFQGTGADAAAISGKGVYLKDAAAATANSYLIHAESDNNGAAYLDGDIDVKLSNNDDFLSIVSNAADYASGAGVITVYDDSTGQGNSSYLLRLAREANGDAEDNFILCEDNSDGTAGNGDDMFSVNTGGAVTAAGLVSANGGLTVGDAVTDNLTITAAIAGASPLILDGNTDDTNETTLAVNDPSTDNTITIPDYSGSLPLVIAQGYTQTSKADGTEDVTGSSLTLADGWFTEGRTIKYSVAGTVTGANAAIAVALYFEDGAKCTLTTTDGAAGDWFAEFEIIATGSATQRINGRLIAEAGAELKVDYATAAIDTAAAGTIPIKLQITSGNVGDTITSEMVRAEFWNKAD